MAGLVATGKFGPLYSGRAMMKITVFMTLICCGDIKEGY
jgi:hypothetical protein